MCLPYSMPPLMVRGGGAKHRRGIRSSVFDSANRNAEINPQKSLHGVQNPLAAAQNVFRMPPRNPACTTGRTRLRRSPAKESSFLHFFPVFPRRECAAPTAGCSRPYRRTSRICPRPPRSAARRVSRRRKCPFPPAAPARADRRDCRHPPRSLPKDTPAEAAKNSSALPAFAARSEKTNSAIGERQILP